MLAIALRTIKELGFDISEDYIGKAGQEYRNFYDLKSIFVRQNFRYYYMSRLRTRIFLPYGCSVNHILTDEMVINHLNQIRCSTEEFAASRIRHGTACIRLTKYQTGLCLSERSYQPFGEFGKSNYADGSQDGVYYNGGSWFRAEYCAYVVGQKHGRKWQKNPDGKSGLEAKLISIKNGPTVKFIPWTTTDSWWPSTRGLCWNIFILMADEVAGFAYS
jgi:hypothetical protein